MHPSTGTLAAGHNAGDWQLPDDFVTLYRAHERLRTAEVPANGTLPSMRGAAARAMIDAATNGTALPGEDHVGDGRRSLDFAAAWESARTDAAEEVDKQLSRYDTTPLYEALQEALDETIERFQADIAAAGPWAGIDPQAIPLRLLDEPRETVDAVKHVLGEAPRRYTAIRQAWAMMRGPGQNVGDYGYRESEDPTLPTAEVRNWRDIAPDWKPADWRDPRKREWKRGMTHMWLADLVTRGAEFWVPSARQQLLKHIEDFPPPPPRPRGGGLVDPFAVRRPSAA